MVNLSRHMTVFTDWQDRERAVWKGKFEYVPSGNVALVPLQVGSLTVTTKNQSTLKFLQLHKPNDSPEECASEG